MSEWKHDPGYGIPIEQNGANQNIDSVKPMLFVGTDENTSGGWHNFEGYFDTIEHAKKHVLTMSNFFDWAHIVVNGKIKVEGQNLKMSVNYPSNWKFTEVDDSEIHQT